MTLSKKAKLNLVANLKEIILAALLLYILWAIIKTLYLGG